MKLSRSTNKNNLIIYEHREIATGQGDDYITDCLLDYNYFNVYYKVIAIDLSKQQALDADPKATQKIKFTGNLNRGENVNDNTITKEIILDFCKEVWKYCESVPQFHLVLI